MRPAFKITVNGGDITAKIADRLVSLTVTDEAGVKSDRVEIVLDDRDAALVIPPKKATLTVAIGYADRLVNKGTYTVEEIEVEGGDGGRRMTIRANAAGPSKGAGASKSKSYHDMTLGGVAGEVAKRNHWELKISDELAAIKIPHIDQDENDLQFMMRVATENGAVAKVAHGKLVFAPHGEGKTTSGKSLPTVTVNARDVGRWSMTESSRGDYAGVKAKYHDKESAETGEEIEGEDGDNATTLPHTYATKESAKRAAKSKLKAAKKATAKLSISGAVGNPAFEAECKAQIVGFRAGVDGTWTVNSVTHTLSDAGYVMSLDCERA